MKSILVFGMAVAFGVAAFADDRDVKFQTGGGISHNGRRAGTPVLEPVETSGAPDQITGKCETKTEGPIPVAVPCRGVELQLLSASGRKVATGNLDPRGAFVFAQIPKGTYNMLIRSLKPAYEVRLDGFKPGYTYDLSLEPPEQVKGR